MADVLSSGRVDNPEDIGPADKNPDPQKAQIATRRMLEEEVRLLRRQLVLMQEELEASRSTMRRGMIARKDSEVLLLKKKIAELMLAAQKLAPRHNGQGRETAKEQVAKRVEGYYNDVLSELGLDLSNLKRKVPHHLRFCEKSDGRMEAIAWIGCNGIQSAPDMHFFDFRFVVASTRSPLHISVGPLKQNCFLLLSRQPQATETAFDKRTFPAGDEGQAQDTIHSLTITKSDKFQDRPFEVGVYYLSVCTDGDRLMDCCVRLYTTTPLAPSMEYGWYGIKRHPVSKIAAKAAQGAWACTKESIANTNSNRTVVSGGNRRFDGTKPQGREIPTPSMDLRATPVRHLYSRADRQRDPASTEWLSNNNKKTQTQIRVQGADRKIVRPSSAPLQRSYGSQLQVRPARISASEHVQTETIGQVKHSHRNHIPRDDTRATHNAQGQRILRPWSALQHRVTSGVMVPQQTPSQRSLSVLENAGPTPHTKKTATKRPASARPASAHGIRPPSTLVPVRQRPASAMGRVREWNFPSWLTSGNLRPSSAMLCDQVLEKRGDDSEVSGGEHGMENPFGSIASSEAHQYLNDPMIMTAEHQLKIMAEKKTHSVVARLLPSQRKSVSGGLKGLIRSHKKDIHLLARKSFVQDLEKTLVEYEERDIERYKLPFADLFLTVHSGRQLPKDPKTSSCDPYLVLTLKDSERGHVAECKTSVIQGNPNPDWKSDFQLNCRNLEKDAILTFNCWHKSTFSRFDDVLLGECSLELRRLKLATSEEWNLRLRASVEHDFDSRIKITTFYGNEEAHKKWKTEVEERRKKQRALAQEKAREQGSSPVPRRSPSPKSVEEVSGRTSSSPINFSPGGSKNPAHNGIHQASDDQASTFINDAARPSSSSQSKMNCQWTMIRENGYSQDIVNEICSTYGHEAWDKLGIGVDVFDFLSLLQKREQGRMSIQTVDFLEPAPRTGTAHQIFPDAETIDLEHVRSFPDELLLYMSQYGGSHIKRLCIGGSNNLTLSAVLVFARGFPLISSLSLNGLRSADDGWISSLAELLHLQELLVSECNNITDRGLMAMVGSSSGLRKLDCSYCFKISDLGIDALAKNCAGLESVNIRGCHNVTAAAISGLFQHCPHLANVDISGLQGISSGIFAASSNLQELRSLNVANCRAFDDKALQYLARLDSMESIIMYANPGVTDIGLAAIATCKNLQTLSLARCSKVTDGGIIKVATGCRHIRRLNLDFCTLVSDNGILFIADFHAELESLSVRGCTQVTGVGVGCVIQHCPRIAALDLAHTGVDQGEIQSALADVQERRTRDQKVEQMAWLAGKKGTSTWSGIEVDSNWLTSPAPIHCEFEIKGGLVASEDVRFNPRRDLPLNWLDASNIEQEGARVQ